MKKLVAIVLVLVLCIGNTVVVNAETHTFEDVTSPNNKKDIDIMSMYEPPASATYSVTISWGALRYKYTDTGVTWDSDETAYKTTASGTWTPVDINGDADETSNMIAIENNSDKYVSIKAEFELTDEVEEWTETVTEDGQQVTYGLNQKYMIEEDDGSFRELTEGNLSTNIDTSVIPGHNYTTMAQAYREIEGYVMISGRPQYLRSINDMRLGTCTITIGAYNQALTPNGVKEIYQ